MSVRRVRCRTHATRAGHWPLRLAIVGTLACGHVPMAGAAAAATPADAASPADAHADAYAEFDRSLLPSGSQAQDLSRFERGQVVLPGVYRLDLYVNDRWVGRADVRFAAPSPQASARPCFDRVLLERLGIGLDGIDPALRQRLAAPRACLALDEVVPQARVAFDQGDLRLDLSVPQADMTRAPRGYVAPEFWDEGMTAALLNYNFNAFRFRNAGHSQEQAYLGLNAGLNIGAWRARYDTAATWQSGHGSHWQKIRAYLQRDLPSLGAQMVVGDTYTDGELFDALSLRGVQLYTDERMLPQSQRGYAPVVRGVARGNAQVRIRQNGALIYQAAVSPGPFVIDDLYPTGYGGDLEVTVTEADGSQQRFEVPYASVQRLLRPGASRFTAVAGTLRDSALAAHPFVVQGTYQRGFGHGLTLYGGVNGSRGYAALLGGTAINTRYGAWSLDLTGTTARLPGAARRDGRSLRLSYSKMLTATDTRLALAAYRYGSRGYLDLRTAEQLRDYQRRGLDASRVLRQRSRFDLNLSQPLGEDGGSLYVTGSLLSYWNRGGHDTQVQAGYQGSAGPVAFSLSAARIRDAFGRADNQVYLNVSVPLGSTTNAPSLTLSATRDSQGADQQQAMLTGSAGDDQRFTYGATLSHAERNAVSVDGGYRSPYATFSAGHTEGDGYAQSSLGVNGALLVHRGGITFGQQTGGTTGLVHAADAAGARVLNGAGVRVDGRGYALVPYLTPYARTEVQIDPSGLPVDVQLESTTQSAVPTAGAIVPIEFRTSDLRTAIFRARIAGGGTLPFGASVEDAKGDPIGVVAQAGRIFARGVDARGSLVVRWDAGRRHAAGQCRFDYTLPDRNRAERSRYQYADAVCVPFATADGGTASRETP